MPLVHADHLMRRFGRFTAVRDVSLTVRRGEVLGLLGLNGAGKSTTLAMLAGVVAPSAGTVHIAGAPLRARGGPPRDTLGYLPDTPPLYDALTVREYLRLAAAIRGVPGRRCDAQAARAIERCDLGTVAPRLLGNLSKGYRQRAGIAQALVHDPDVLILDEPSSGLDPAQLQSVRELVRGLAREHAVVFSTHLLSEAQAVCDRVQIIHHGRSLHEADLTAAPTDPPTQYRLAFAREVPTAALEGIPGVDEVIRQGRYHRLRLAPGTAPATALRALLARDLPVTELIPDQDDLESLFVQVTTRGDAADAP